jgi:hypothetical protein
MDRSDDRPRGGNDTGFALRLIVATGTADGIDHRLTVG